MRRRQRVCGRFACLAVVVACVSLPSGAAGGVVSAHAQPLPRILLSCYECPRGSGYALFTLSADGALSMVLPERDGGYGLALSPDRRAIVYAEDACMDYVLWRRQLHGKGSVRLTRPPCKDTTLRADAEPAWSPDGSQIAFARNVRKADADNANHFSIWLVDSSGRGSARRLTVGQFPDWSPDGKVIAFLRHRAGASRFYVIRPDGTHLHRLAGASRDSSPPRWSPDGSRIAYVIWAATDSGAPDQIRILDVASGRVRTIALAVSVSVQGVRWSPDGRWLAYITTEDEDPDSDGEYCGGCHSNIWIVRVSDGYQRKIFSQDDTDIGGLDW